METNKLAEYKKIINRYIESEEMKKYLINVSHALRDRQIIDIICGARADLKDKYESLLSLAEIETAEERKDECSAYNTAKNAKKLLRELTLKPGEVLLNMEYGYDRERAEEIIYGAAPHFTLKSLMKYVKEEYEELDEKTDALYWYRLEKYVPKKDEELDWRCYYTAAPNGEIWFASDTGKEDISIDDSQNLNLPVPFEVGDIITIDCRPFAPVKRAVILEKRDNFSCCGISCAWITNEGRINTGALKHTTLFDDKSFIRVSPLYRAEIYKGEPPKAERPLLDISKYIYRSEKKGEKLWQFIYETDKSGKGLDFKEITSY